MFAYFGNLVQTNLNANVFVVRRNSPLGSHELYSFLSTQLNANGYDAWVKFTSPWSKPLKV